MELKSLLLPPWLQSGFGEAIFYLLLVVAFLGTLFWILKVLAKPYRSQEKIKITLDLLERSLDANGNPAHTFANLLSREKPGLLFIPYGPLCDALESGVPLVQALQRKAHWIPRPILETLASGEKMGCLKESLPTCREMLQDVRSPEIRAYNHMLTYGLLAMTTLLGMNLVIRSFITPKFGWILTDMGAPLTSTVRAAALQMAQTHWLDWVPFLFLLLWLILESLGPWPTHMPLNKYLFRLDHIDGWLPWKRLRLIRQFFRVFSLAQKSGLTEPHALSLAAESTGSKRMILWAAHARQELAHGLKLESLISEWDEHGELKWRLGHRRHGTRKFEDSMSGWCRFLTLRALKMEIHTKQILSVLVMVTSGITIGRLATHVFVFLTGIMEGVSVW